MLQQAAAKPVPVVEAGVVDVCFTGQVAFNRTVRVAMRPHRVDKRGLGCVRELGVASVVGSACFNGDRAYAPDCVLRGGDEYFCSEGQGDSFLEVAQHTCARARARTHAHTHTHNPHTHTH